jgi:DEAD/DEAH box helicase domain-containing protein
MLEHSSELPRARTLLPETLEISSVSACAGESSVFRRPFSAAECRALVERLQAREETEVVAVRNTPGRPAEHADWPDWIEDPVRAAFRARGVERPYAHQVEALARIGAGEDIVLATPTASGKSLCYRAPLVQSIVGDPGARALLLFPTKALSRDQVEGLRELVGATDATRGRVGAGVYDGDTPPDARRAARAKAHVVATNPDMLHRALLPNHERWGRFLAGLRYVVLDELHTYRGVFGSHVAHVLRRLWRVCAFHGSRPQVIACSATIANPEELATRLTGRDRFTVVDRDTSPAGPRTFIVLNPRVVDEQTGVRRNTLKVTRVVTGEVMRAGVSTLAFCRTRKAVELLCRYLREDLAGVRTDRFGVAEGPVDPARLARAHKAVRAYRGGYLPELRREVEASLRSGEARVVASTNALELGMDIGGLDAVVLAGYPGTRAATMQRAGRAGRRGRASLVAMVLSSRPVDQLIAGACDQFLFSRSPEHARVDPDNPEVSIPHLRCAAHELPLDVQHAPYPGIPTEELSDVLGYLSSTGSLLRLADDRGERFVGLGGTSPARTIDIRGPLEENFTVVEVRPGSIDARAEHGKILAQVDFEDGPLYLHPGAIYPLEGATYEVRELDWDARKAFVQPVRSDYYTEAIAELRVRVVEPVRGARGAAGAAPVDDPHGLGYAHVVRSVPGFKKLRFGSHENVGFGPIELPDLELHTVAAYWRVPAEALRRLADPAVRSAAALAAAHAIHHVGAMVCMCDTGDLAHAVGAGHEGGWAPVTRNAFGGGVTPEAEMVAMGAPTLYLYDRLPGGAGLAVRVYELGRAFFELAAAAVSGCSCDRGCPACIGAAADFSEGTGGDGLTRLRPAVLEILRCLADAVEAPVVSAPASSSATSGCFEHRVYSGRSGWEIDSGALRRAVVGLGGSRVLGSEDPIGSIGRIAFVDLETTGLGAHPMPFVIGLAYVGSGAESGLGGNAAGLVVEQWTALDRYCEPAMLRAFVARARELGLGVDPRAVWLSFNGASFDLPLLRRRVARLSLPWFEREPRHLDLLPPARRLWRDRFEDCRLGTLERRVLARPRQGDIPSHQIPWVFDDFVRDPTGGRADLDRVGRHNRLDLANLPALALAMQAVLDDPSDPGEALRAAVHHQAVGAPAAALSTATRGLAPLISGRNPSAAGPGTPGGRTGVASSATIDPRHRALGIFAAGAWRRAGRPREAARIWEHLVRHFPRDPEVCEGWAKVLEHERRDYSGALAVARASARPCAHRIARLQRRCVTVAGDVIP